MSKFFVLVGVVLLSITTAFAEVSVAKIPSIVITTKVVGHGNVRVVLNTERNFGAQSNAKFYQGYYIRRGQEFPVAATYVNGKYKVLFAGKLTGSSGKRQRHYSVTLDKELKQVKVSSAPASILSAKSCAAHEKTDSSNNITTNYVRNETLQISISTFADIEWVNKFGPLANTEILSAINEAETLYYRQLKIRFKVISQQTLADITETDSSLLLQQFARNPKTSTTANVKFLFTGKDMDSSVIGIAYIGVVCYAPNYAYGVVQSYQSITSHIFAHELGHSLSAQHDTSEYGNVMYPSVSMWDPYFTANSLNEINSMISSYGSCIEQLSPPVQLKPGVLSLYKKGSYVVGTVYSKTYQPIQNSSVTIYVNNKKQTTTTNADGQYKLRIVAKKGSAVHVVVQIGKLRKQIKFKM